MAERKSDVSKEMGEIRRMRGSRTFEEAWISVGRKRKIKRT